MARYVIVGMGPAGMACAEAIRSIDSEGEICGFSSENMLPYSRVILTDMIAGKCGRDDLYLAARQRLIDRRIRLSLGSRVTVVDTQRDTVCLENGGSLQYDCLLLSTGGRPIFPSIAQSGVQGIVGMRNYSDALYIARKREEGAKIVVLGGGLLGVKLACALHIAGDSPEMVVRSSRILSQVADTEGAWIVENWMRSAGIGIRTGCEIVGVESQDGALRSVAVTGNKEIPCQVLVVCRGVEPNLDYLPNVWSGSNGIEVDSSMKTAFPRVYAAGDVALAPSLPANEKRCIAIWPNAVEQGRVAGYNMAGKICHSRESLRRNALDVLGLPFISMGTVEAHSEKGWDVSIERAGDTYRKLIFQSGRLVGAVLVGEVREAGYIQARIRKDNARAEIPWKETRLQ